MQYNNEGTFPEIGVCRSDLLILFHFTPDRITEKGYVEYSAPKVVKTIDGNYVFSPFRDIGTVGTDADEIRAKVQFSHNITEATALRSQANPPDSQFLITGNVRFVTQDGEPLLAYSSFFEVGLSDIMADHASVTNGSAAE